MSTNHHLRDGDDDDDNGAPVTDDEEMIEGGDGLFEEADMLEYDSERA